MAIDDFGTGYSSFAMLRDFTVDRLKIDGSFVDGIAQSLRQQHLVKAIVGLANGLGIETVAEGVETEESWLTLAELGCDIAQGLLICRPIPMPELVDWLDIRQSMSALEHVPRDHRRRSPRRGADRAADAVESLAPLGQLTDAPRVVGVAEHRHCSC